MAAQGLGVLLVGLLAQFGFRSILAPVLNGTFGWGSFGGMSAAFRFPLIFSAIICVIGVVMAVGGLVLAAVWKRRVQK